MNTAIEKCGFVAIIGPPNAGKSTLVNHLVGEKIAIVTQKAQTTRARMRGIMLEGDAQIILVDTPGIFTPKQKLDHAMVRAAWAGAEEADILLFLLDARHALAAQAQAIIANLGQSKKPVILALNKIDLIAPPELLATIKALNEQFAFHESFLISAKTGDGLSELKQKLSDLMPRGTWLYPEDQITDIPLYLTASEITREKIFLRLHQELPYAITVETDKFTRNKDGSVRIEQTIYTRRAGQKSIILGKQGAMVKSIGIDARKELEDILEARVHLFIFVKQRENWQNDPARYRMMGLDYKG